MSKNCVEVVGGIENKIHKIKLQNVPATKLTNLFGTNALRCQLNQIKLLLLKHKLEIRQRLNSNL